jgi:N-acyl-phosphatidylethanolamine-hydrolysing phospholipase D
MGKCVRRIFSVCIIILVISGSGCRTLYDVVHNTFSVFSSPEKIKNKIKNPIRDSIKLSALWVGHATVLIQIEDKVILTDPFFTNNVAQIQRRIIEPGVDLDDIPKCDLILISHSHFDHLNLGTLSLLEDKFSDCDLVYPEGLENFLPDLNFNFHKLKKPDGSKKIYFGETKTINGLKITTVAAFHWGGRYGLDGLMWGDNSFTGYVIEYMGKTIYFSGDTAYDEEFFKLLGEKFTIDMEFIPIGPCREDKCFEIQKENFHVYPKGSLMILEDTKSKIMVPIHYGTIYEKSNPLKPRWALEELLADKPDLMDKVKILQIGEQIVIK